MGRQWDGWRADRRQRKRRTWHGYIDVGSIDTWNVRLAEPSHTNSAVVTIEITKANGTPNDQGAATFRRVVQRDGFLSRSPTVAELDFLKHLRKRQGYGQRNEPIR